MAGLNHHGYPDIPGFHWHPSHCTDGEPDYCNHHIIGRHKLPAHFPPRCLSSEGEALSCKLEEGVKDSDNLVLLTPAGTRWAFHFADNPQDCPEMIPGKGFDQAGWGDILVPSVWETQNYGQPLYTNFQYPFKVDPPLIPDGMNHVGSYQTQIRVPAAWTGRRVFLCFEGVSAAFHLWIDGSPVGYSQDSRLNAEFDITGAVKPGGTHTMSLRVYRFCDGSYLEDQDMWWLSGVHRDVVLYSKPAAAHIWDVCTKTDVRIPQGQLKGLSDAPATLTVDVTVRSHTMTQEDLATKASLTASLFGPHMLEAGETHADPPAGTAAVFKNVKATVVRGKGGDGFGGAEQVLLRIEMSVGPVKLWSAEQPWLYTLVVQLGGEGGGEVEVLRVGFKSVFCSGNKFVVNGAAPYIYGVNRHEHNERTGKFMDLEAMMKDIRVLKQFNVNAVRTSHYPNRSLWYSLCDAHGLYIVDEANIETHGLALETSEDLLANDKEWEPCFVDRAKRMIQRDRNHACIIMWSLGNEASYGKTHDVMYKMMKDLDPSRPVHYESCGGAPATDVICPMYPSVEKLKKLAGLPEQNKANSEIGRTWPTGKHTHARPVIMCEYAHAMGNSTGNMDEYWDLIRSTDGLQGGFIWDWMDQGLLVEDGGKKWWAYGGDYGEAIHDANFNINGLCFPDHTPHPGLHQVKYNYQPAAFEATWLPWRPGGEMRAKVTVLNRYDFVTLGHLDLRWRVDVEGKPVAEGLVKSLQQAAAGGLSTHEIAFQKAGKLGGGECLLTVALHLGKDTTWAKAGHQVAWEQFAVPSQPFMVAPLALPCRALRVEDGKEELCVVGEGLTAAFCKKRGGLVSLKVGGVELLASRKDKYGALLQNFWRCPTDNDQGGIDTVIGSKGPQVWNETSGMGNGKGTRIRVTPALAFAVFWTNLWDDVSYALKWRKQGIDRLVPTDVDVAIAGEGAGKVVVRCRYTMHASGQIQNRSTFTWAMIEGGKSPSGRIKCESTYTVYTSGDMVIKNSCYVAPTLPTLPRVGLQLTLAPGLDNLTYYGRGPYECYTDRATGAQIGRYETKVADTDVPYLFPSENGNRADVRWAAVTNDKGVGLVISSAAEGEVVHVSAHDYTDSDLQAAMHPHEIKKQREATVTVDVRQMGIGGTDTWSRSVLNKYLIPPGTHTYSVRLSPISSAGAISRPLPLPDSDPSAHAYSHAGPPFVARTVASAHTFVCECVGKAPFLLAEQGVMAAKTVQSVPTPVYVVVVLASAAFIVKLYTSK